MIIRIHSKEFGVYYNIQTNVDDWGYYLTNQDEETMSVSEQNIFDLLHEYFQKEF